MAKNVNHPAPSTCPICGDSLQVTRLDCHACGTSLEGRFGLGRLGRLSREQTQFVETFLECRGKIKDVEQKLGISYPTVIARLEQVITAMGFTASNEPPPPPVRDRARRGEVLEALERGEITAAEAMSRLRAPNNGDG